MKKLVRMKASDALLWYRLIFAWRSVVNSYKKLILDVVHDLRKEGVINEK